MKASIVPCILTFVLAASQGGLSAPTQAKPASVLETDEVVNRIIESIGPDAIYYRRNGRVQYKTPIKARSESDFTAEKADLRSYWPREEEKKEEFTAEAADLRSYWPRDEDGDFEVEDRNLRSYWPRDEDGDFEVEDRNLRSYWPRDNGNQVKA